MVDEFVRGGGQAHDQGGRRRERMGFAIQGGLRGIGVSFSTWWERHTTGSKRHCAKGWAAGGATRIFIARKAFP